MINYVGDKYHRLTCLSQRSEGPPKSAVWITCRCVCGTVKEYRAGNVRASLTKSCGCLRKENQGRYNFKHGMSTTSAYKSWSLMRQRCLHKKCPDYKNYGGKGVTICSRWSEFLNFYEDMGDRPKGYYLNLSFLHKVYNKENCLWVPHKVFPRAGRKPKWWVVKGVRYGSLLEAEFKEGVAHSTIINWCNGRKDRYGVHPAKAGCYSELK